VMTGAAQASGLASFKQKPKPDAKRKEASDGMYLFHMLDS